MKPLLAIKELHVHYGAIHAIKGINFEVFPGEVISLVGANGAGKTTILKAISGLLPFEGTIGFAEADLKLLKPHQIVGLGLSHAPEGRGIFGPLTVRENLEMGAYSRKDKKISEDMAHCLDLFPRLRERLKQIAGTLSGGEQQMLAISRALMARPKLLMLDEPSLGLAPQIVQQIFEIIRKINKEDQVTVLLVEQNARMALKHSHRGYVIETGLLKLTGTGKDLLENEEVRKYYLGG